MILEITKTNTVTLEYVDGKEPVRHEHERVYTTTRMLYRELSPAAKKRAREDAIEREWREPWGHYSFCCEDIWGELHRIEELAPVEFREGYNEQDIWAVAKTCSVPTAIKLEDTGICYSMDLCAEWNKYLPQLATIERGQEFADARDDYNEFCKLSNLAEAAWEALLERAGNAVAKVASELLRAEQDWYTSHEFWDEWLDDGETWFTAEGERW